MQLTTQQPSAASSIPVALPVSVGVQSSPEATKAINYAIREVDRHSDHVDTGHTLQQLQKMKGSTSIQELDMMKQKVDEIKKARLDLKASVNETRREARATSREIQMQQKQIKQMASTAAGSETSEHQRQIDNKETTEDKGQKSMRRAGMSLLLTASNLFTLSEKSIRRRSYIMTAILLLKDRQALAIYKSGVSVLIMARSAMISKVRAMSARECLEQSSVSDGARVTAIMKAIEEHGNAVMLDNARIALNIIHMAKLIMRSRQDGPAALAMKLYRSLWVCRGQTTRKILTWKKAISTMTAKDCQEKQTSDSRFPRSAIFNGNQWQTVEEFPRDARQTLLYAMAEYTKVQQKQIARWQKQAVNKAENSKLAARAMKQFAYVYAQQAYSKIAQMFGLANDNQIADSAVKADNDAWIKVLGAWVLLDSLFTEAQQAMTRIEQSIKQALNFKGYYLFRIRAAANHVALIKSQRLAFSKISFAFVSHVMEHNAAQMSNGKTFEVKLGSKWSIDAMQNKYVGYVTGDGQAFAQAFDNAADSEPIAIETKTQQDLDDEAKKEEMEKKRAAKTIEAEKEEKKQQATERENRLRIEEFFRFVFENPRATRDDILNGISSRPDLEGELLEALKTEKGEELFVKMANDAYEEYVAPKRGKRRPFSTIQDVAGYNVVAKMGQQPQPIFEGAFALLQYVSAILIRQTSEPFLAEQARLKRELEEKEDATLLKEREDIMRQRIAEGNQIIGQAQHQAQQEEQTIIGRAAGKAAAWVGAARTERAAIAEKARQEVDDLKRQKAALERQVQQDRSDLQQGQTNLQALQNEIEQANAASHESDAQIQAFNEQLQKIQADKDSVTKELTDLTQLRDKNTQELQQLKDEVHTNNQHLRQKKKKLKALNKRTAASEAALQNAQNEIERLNLSIPALQARAEQENQQLRSVQKAKGTEQAQVDQLRADLANTQREIAKAQTAKRTAEQETVDLRKAVADNTQTLARVKQSVYAEQGKLIELRNAAADMSKKEEEGQARLDGLKSEVAQIAKQHAGGTKRLQELMAQQRTEVEEVHKKKLELKTLTAEITQKRHALQKAQRDLSEFTQMHARITARQPTARPPRTPGIGIGRHRAPGQTPSPHVQFRGPWHLEQGKHPARAGAEGEEDAPAAGADLGGGLGRPGSAGEEAAPAAGAGGGGAEGT